jgi:hypothetical protein
MLPQLKTGFYQASPFMSMLMAKNRTKGCLNLTICRKILLKNPAFYGIIPVKMGF